MSTTTTPTHSLAGPIVTVLSAALTLAVHGGVIWQKVDSVERQLTKVLDEHRELDRRLARVEANQKDR